MKEVICITQDQANELLTTLSECPIPYKYSNVILIVQRWLAEKFNEEEVYKEENAST